MKGRLRLLLVGLAAAAAGALAFTADEGESPAQGPATRPATQPATRPATQPASRPFKAPPHAIVTEEGWFAKPEVRTDKPKLPAAPQNVFVIPIREEIGTKTFEAIARKASRCRASGADLIIFDMDTWGGQVEAALDITRLIKTDLKDIHTVCFIRTRGVSAGAMIAMACDEIAMTPVGKFGDAAPVSMGGTIKGVEREKLETVIRSEFKESARRNGYSQALAQSMVSASLEVWLIRSRKTGELRYGLDEELLGSVSLPPSVSKTGFDPNLEWELVRIVVYVDRLLTLDPPDAKKYRFVKKIVEVPAGDPLGELKKAFNVSGKVTSLEDNWSERLVAFLTSPLMTALLLMTGLVCLYSEMRMPGFGVLGAIGIACFAVLFGSRYLVRLAQLWEIGLFILGLILIGLEIFVIPGFGVTGISGIICCIVALIAMVVPNPPFKLPIPETDLDWTIFENGAFGLAVGFIAAMVLGAVLARLLPKMPVASKLVLVPAGAGGKDASVSDTAAVTRIKPGDVGTVEGICRPVGKVRFGDDLVDASSEGDIIEVGASVRVLRREGNRVIVERVGSE
ncbi:MAG: NfeD family protein [Planctomycetota bacterium]|jgi:membrane-bound serine protease (ClpP class)